MGNGIEITMLGGFRVVIDGRVVPAEAWRHRRGADLVKLLALSPGHRLHREQVMEALWPDLAPVASAGNLRKAVHFARAALGADAVRVSAGVLELSPDAPTSVDLHRFERAAAGFGNPARAVSLYGGELLPDDRYEDWTAEPRERARRTYLRLLRSAEDWERILETDPADEEAHRRLMASHIDAGNRQAAIRQFDRLRMVLRDELGVSPDAATVELYEKVLDMDGPEPPTLAERADGLIARGLVHWNRRELDEAERIAREARTLAIDAGLGHALGEASALLGLVAHARGRWRELFRAEFERSVRGSPELAGFVFDAHLCFAEFSLYQPAGHEEAGPFAEELLRIADEAGSDRGRAIARLMLGEIALFSSRLDEAERELELAAELAASTGHISAESLTTVRLAESAIARKQQRRTARLLGKARRLAEGAPLESHLLVRVLGAAVQAAADPERARTVIDEAERALERRVVCEPCSMPFRVEAASAAARAGDRNRAARYLEEAERLAGMWQGGPWQAAVWAARGELRRAEGDGSRAAALFREAADAYTRLGRSIDAERCLAAADAV